MDLQPFDFSTNYAGLECCDMYHKWLMSHDVTKSDTFFLPSPAGISAVYADNVSHLDPFKLLLSYFQHANSLNNMSPSSPRLVLQILRNACNSYDSNIW